jgi:hypothetical protein
LYPHEDDVALARAIITCRDEGARPATPLVGTEKRLASAVHPGARTASSAVPTISGEFPRAARFHSGQNQERPFGKLYRLALLGIELIEKTGDFRSLARRDSPGAQPVAKPEKPFYTMPQDPTNQLGSWYWVSSESRGWQAFLVNGTVRVPPVGTKTFAD